MTSPGELALLLSELQGRPLPTVNYYAKALRDAGFLSKGGRGPSAAEMTRDDAINLLIALCGCYTAASAPDMIEIWRSMQPTPQVKGGKPPTFINTVARFDEFLHGLMEFVGSGGLDQWTGREHFSAFALDFHTGQYVAEFTLERYSIEANRRVSSVTMRFEGESMVPRRRTDDEPPVSDRTDIVRIGKRTIAALADATAAEAGK